MVGDMVGLARSMMRMAATIDLRCRPADLVQHRFEGAPFGIAYAAICPSDTGQFASGNHNRLYLCGADGGLTEGGLAQMLRLFEGVPRHFVWLNPGSNLETVRTWLAAAGLKRVPYVSYPTLVRDASPCPPASTDLSVREVQPDEIANLWNVPNDNAFPDFARSAGAEGFHHFMAFHGSRAVARAALCVADRLGYLGMTFTAEADRRRGAQQALIASRIAKARALNCDCLVSETLSMLTASLANLQRAGFEHAYDKEVYASPEG